MSSLVVTVVGPDRPGLVGRLSDVIRTNGGNWLESRMSHLADQFAGIVLVDVADDQAETLLNQLEQLQTEGLRIIAQLDAASAVFAAQGSQWVLNVVGNDRPGIVREVTQVLAAHNVNVEELSTECADAPHSGGRIFKAEVRLRVPTDLAAETLATELERIATDVMIDLNPL